MAYLPVPSLQTGGLLWFTDLTAADPFYILPLAVTGTMFFILEVSRLSPNQSNCRMCYGGFNLFHVIPLFLNLLCRFLVGCRVWYRQPKPASHEDCVQDHALNHPPSHHQLPHGQSVILTQPFYL